MSKRVLAPALLLLAAVISIAAVFAVHHIEAGGGPLSEPYATQYISPTPGGDPARDVAVIRFNSKQTEQLTVVIRDCNGGAIVRHLLRDKRRHKGAQYLRWDGKDDHGTLLPDGCYSVDIRRLGDDRIYQPAKPTWIDTNPPVAAIDRSAIKDGYWRGLIFTEPGVKLVYRTPDGTLLDPAKIEAKIFPARQHHSSGTARVITPPPGSVAYRFSVKITGHPRLLVTAVDDAGNSTKLPTNEIERAQVVK